MTRRMLRLLSLCFVLGVPAWTQSGPPPILPPIPETQRDRRDRRTATLDEDAERIEREQLKKLNKERQDALKKDTDRLLALATELKQYVDKTNEHVLSVDVIRKAEEIEKLARSVRSKMRSQ